ncbi:MAG: tetratricopeptide repeat protein [Myxococcales bacterium]|nr:tetratricopeptide repeat protein [Myxococcales bacterium]
MSDDLDPVAQQGFHAASQIDHLLAVGRIDAAQERAMAAIAASPESPGPHVMLAQVLLQADRAADALEATGRALALAPDSDLAMFYRAVALLALGRFSESEQTIRRALAIAPDDPDHWMIYARLLSMCDADVQALEAAEQALSLNPDAPELHRLRGELLLHVHPRHWRISEDAVRTALRIDPHDPDNHALFGHVSLLAGRHQEAESAFRTALRVDPSNALALSGLSTLVKGKYWWYRPMMAWTDLLRRQGRDGQLAIVFGLWAVYAAVIALVPPEYGQARQALTFGYLGLCLYTWFAEPITRALLRRVYPWLE